MLCNKNLLYTLGVLLLDTILQPTIAIGCTDSKVKIEMLLSEGVLMHQALISLEQQGVESSVDVTNELVQKIEEAQHRPKKGIKAQKVYFKLIIIHISN